MKAVKYLIFIAVVGLSFVLHPIQKENAQAYVSQYKDFAIIEMYRSGVPASITLAQGILESSSGKSRLAREGNNHFGIKCKSDWKGKTIYADDDAPNECFRAYPSALESYQDHSDFLRTNWRYHPLFELERTDYKGWAKGLRKAGYATNPKYHIILIDIIERYELHQYDLAPMPQKEKEATIKTNEIPATYVKEGETAEEIARRNDLKEKHIYKWNDLEKGSDLSKGDIVYLKPKKRKGSVEYHVVQKGEDMYTISQMHGIKLKHLYKKNRLDYGLQPVEGEKLYLQKKRDRADEVNTATEAEEEKTEEFVNPNLSKTLDTTNFNNPGPLNVKNIEVPEYHLVKSGDNLYRIAERYQILEEDILKWNGVVATSLVVGSKIYLSEEAAAKNGGGTVTLPKKESPKNDPPKNVEVIKYHTVSAGETVYRICQKYGISAEQLRSWNNMDGNAIYVGQKLQVSGK